jgi:hypothetical protein
MLQKVREAGQLLARLEPERLSPEHRRDLRGELAALRAHAAYLLGEMDERPAPQSPRRASKGILRAPYRNIPARLLGRLGLRPMARSP